MRTMTHDGTRGHTMTHDGRRWHTTTHEEKIEEDRFAPCQVGSGGGLGAFGKKYARICAETTGIIDRTWRGKGTAMRARVCLGICTCRRRLDQCPALACCPPGPSLRFLHLAVILTCACVLNMANDRSRRRFPPRRVLCGHLHLRTSKSRPPCFPGMGSVLRSPRRW